MADTIFVEGEVAFDAPNAGKPCKTWYKTAGDLHGAGNRPIVLLHGGPGCVGSPTLVPYVDLYTKHGIPIVLYDQLGCGNSTRLPEKAGDATFWNFELFQKEIDNLVDHLDLREKGFYLGGPSFGGMLGASYAWNRPRGLLKLFICNACGSCPLAIEGLAKATREGPPEDFSIIEDCHSRMDLDNPDYQSAVFRLMQRHYCRLDPWPAELKALMSLDADKTSFHTMHGPSELLVRGSFKDWEGYKEAHNIKVPTLLMTGRYSYLGEPSFETWMQTIPNIDWIKYENSSQTPQFEEREKYMADLAAFLKK